MNKFVLAGDDDKELASAYASIMSMTLGHVEPMFSEFVPLVIAGIAMPVLNRMLTEEGLMLKSMMAAEVDRELTIHIFLRYIKENQKDLREYNLIEIFLSLLNQPHLISKLLNELIQCGKV
jgi:hypothetical protein